MYVDKQNMMSNAQAITADAASTDLIDYAGQSSYDIGPGEPMAVLVVVTEAFNNLTSLELQVQCDDDVAFGSARTLNKLLVALADLTLGAQFTIPVNLERVERYVRMNYDVTGTAPSTGKVTAILMPISAIQSRGFRDA